MMLFKTQDVVRFIMFGSGQSMKIQLVGFSTVFFFFFQKKILTGTSSFTGVVQNLKSQQIKS